MEVNSSFGKYWD